VAFVAAGGAAALEELMKNEQACADALDDAIELKELMEQLLEEQ